MLMIFCKNILSNVTKQSYLILLIAILFAACTDYEAMIEDDYEEWEYAQHLSSSSAMLRNVSSSSIKNVIESSSSKENISSSSEKQVVSSSSEGAVSSSSKKGENSSSSQNAKSSSSVLLSSSSITPISSSSSKNELSSSSILSSSSGKASWAYLNPAISYGEITDDRDGQVYKIVKIGEQTWMAENLNYETSNYSNCYKNIDANCTKFGRIYTWSAAMIACPSDWRLPDKGDWNDLITYVGGASIAGKKLKSIVGWNSDGNGTDTFGFSAYPAGGLSGGYYDEGTNALFWSTTENEDGSGAFDLDLYYMDDDADLIENDKGSRYSVRCIMNIKESPKSSSSIASSSSIKYEILTDDRDGKTYKAVVIGTQTWMAENLNFETENSFCYNDSAKYCTKYGRLYTWSAAMDSAGTWSSNGKDCGQFNYVSCYPTYPVRGVCPDGWHLPTSSEYWHLFYGIGGETTAGKKLKASTGWNNYNEKSGDGSDDYFFTALPAGFRGNNGNYASEGVALYLWSSTENSGDKANYMIINNSDDYVKQDDFLEKKFGFSVRCVKD